MRPSLVAAVVFVSIGSVSRAEPEPTLSPPVALADTVLAETGSAAEAARRWLRENLSNDAVLGMADETRQAVIARFDAALDEARRRHAESLGLFLLDAPDGAGERRWRRLAEGEAPPARAVVLVHGLDEGGPIWDEAAPAIAGAGYAVLRFNYPNDQAIAASTDGLAEALRDLHARGVRSVDIVGHSMGGLVARDLLTRPAHYGGDASAHAGLPAAPRLITLGTPHNGAPLAPLRGAMEVRDQFVRWLASDRKDTADLLGFMVDGGGEAGADLAPGSAFLVELNERPAPKHVAITCVVARLGLNGWSRFDSALDSAFIRRVVGEDRAASMRREVDALRCRLGDGAVPDESARLAGCGDVVEVDANHRSMVRTLEPLEAARDALGLDNPTPPALPVILDRLARPAPPAPRG